MSTLTLSGRDLDGRLVTEMIINPAREKDTVRELLADDDIARIDIRPTTRTEQPMPLDALDLWRSRARALLLNGRTPAELVAALAEVLHEDE